MTLEDLAARITEYGVHIPALSLSRIERGERTVLDFELRAIAKALVVTMAWLADEEGIDEDREQRRRGDRTLK